MLRVRYTAWDGRWAESVDASTVLAALASRLSRSDSVADALAELMREGVELEGGARIAGLEELLERVRRGLKERYARLDIESALEELWEKVAGIIEREGIGATDRSYPVAAARRWAGERLSEAIGRLRSRRLRDVSSLDLTQELAAELGRVRGLEQLWRQGIGRRRFAQPMSYAEAVSLLEEIEQLRALEKQLLGADPSRIDAGLLSAFLGAGAEEELRGISAAVALLEKAGYVIQRGGRAVLSPKGVRGVGHLALRDIYHRMARDRQGGHAVEKGGGGGIRRESSRSFAFGEPFHIDLGGTLRQAIGRRARVPVKLEPADFMTFDADYSTSAATVLLLDMSWSMSWEGRFAAAKKVAMALESLIRTKFPQDFFAIVGFFTRAVELKVGDLPEACWNVGDPFTNLQDGLRLAGKVLARQRLRNRQIILITDGQPTAYTAGGRLYCEWPLSFGGIGLRAAQAALEEVGRITRLGIRLNTFMLDDSPSLKVFVERITRLNRGRALYTRPGRLGRYILVDYVSRRRRKV